MRAAIEHCRDAISVRAAAVAEALFTPLLIKNIKDESGSMKTGMWKLQALMHIPLAALSLYKAFGPKDE